ncbi:transient receptor potential cation channel subfamily M member 2 [Trichonephila clavata]|uniref:Transient receptor potential cation channel subfamily M member 2 n=1 Tax=Trichonephila clavata TaxID=2740835 RepID=A0A8X6IRA7_TRICU|nr:transient receptor potential cation channel subfamily M member 2 [Trichonephila clavata]
MNIEFGRCPFEERRRRELETDETIAREDALLFEDEDVQFGRLYYGGHGSDVKHMPFILSSHSASMDSVFSKIMLDWKLPTPRIVLFVVASSTDSISERIQRLSILLIKGLIAALKTTEMWLCTEGFYEGFGKDLGLAYVNERSRRKVMVSSKHKRSVYNFPDTALIGICGEEFVKFSDQFEIKQTLNGEEKRKKSRKKEINPNFEYFLLMKDTPEKKGQEQFLLNFANYLINNLAINKKRENFEAEEFSENRFESPVMIILFRGDVSQIDLILGYLKNELPVIIMDGSGGLSDLLAYAYNQVMSRPEGVNIAEYTETVLKPQISEKIRYLYPDLSEFKISEKILTQKVFDCIRFSKQGDMEFMSILTLYDLEKKTSHFPAHLLRALFKSKAPKRIGGSENMKRDLFLAMDWNCPNVAMSQILARDPSNKFQVDAEIFFSAIIKPQREQFVGLFLRKGFVVHKFLNSSIFLELFQNSLQKEFFKTVIWENVLGFGARAQLTRNFVDATLTLLLEELTSIPSLMNTYKLDWNFHGVYDNLSPEEVERQSIIVLILWAILSYRVQLVKIMLRYSEYPIHMTLVCSLILHKLHFYAIDLNLKNEMEKQSKELSLMGSELMTKCYNKQPRRALDLLCEKNKIWSYKSLIDIAAFARNKMFIAHPCCQKYLDSIFMGRIMVRDLPYGDITIPLWLKIILCNFLIFPMYFWIKFEIDDNAVSIDISDTNNRRSFHALNTTESTKTLSPPSVRYVSMKRKIQQLSFLNKLYYLYTAPISKFWTSQVFYLIYLFFFSLAVIWPACGSLYLDFITCIWTGFIIMDYMIHVYFLRQKYSRMPLIHEYTEIITMTIFLLCYVLNRIVGHQYFMSPYSVKVMLCLALLYFYYRLIFISFPISPDLGPLLYKIKRMTLVDFLSYMRVTMLVIISNGIVIHATIYPDYPLGWELARRAFYNAMISFFLTPADHFGIPDMTCIKLTRHPNGHSFLGLPEDVCKVGRYYRPDCPNPGVWPYIFGLQYLLLLRLILITLLYALFNATNAKLVDEGTYIWKYQRYQLVVDFSNHLTFPAPLSPINYCLLFFKCIYHSIFGKKDKKSNFLNLTETDYVYWKNLASEYFDDKFNEKEVENTTKWRMSKVLELSNTLNDQRRNLRLLQVKLNELQVHIKKDHQYLESRSLQMSVTEYLQVKNVPQIISRISPYPGTKISRFPVSDKHVPWKYVWNDYDPIAYNMPIKDFPARYRQFVDVDIQLLRETEGENFQIPTYKWNKSTLSPAGIFLDRQSWIKGKLDTPFTYELDEEGLPRNPLGRTGLRGRGRLPQWGPNHFMFAIITRWQELENVSYRDYLEVVLLLNDEDLSIPGGFVHTENSYSAVAELFKVGTPWLSEEAMISFFESAAQMPDSSSSTQEKDSSNIDDGETETQQEEDTKTSSKEENKDGTTEESKELDKPFISQQLKRGYMDDAVNTDQSWCEAEVWHFHYNVPCLIEEKFKDDLIWIQLNEIILHKIPVAQASLLYTVAKKMKAVLEVM